MLFFFPAVSFTIIEFFTLLLFIWSRSSAPDLLHSQIILPATIAVLIMGLALSAVFWKMHADQQKKHQSALIRWGKEFANFPTALPTVIFISVQLIMGSSFAGWFALRLSTQATKFYPILFWTFFTSLVMTLWLSRIFITRFKFLAQVKKTSGQVFVGWLIGISLAVYGGERLRQNISIFTDQNFILKYQVWINRSTAIIFPLMMIDLLVILALLFAFIEHESEHSIKVAEFRLRVNRYSNNLEAWMQSHLKFVMQPAFLALFITAIFFVVFFLCFRVAYGSDGDDLAIISLLSGYGGNTPTAYTVFLNYGLAYSLMLLYGLHTTINWLMIFLVGIIFFATSALLYAFISSNSFRKADRFLAVVFVLAFTSYLLMHLTYTMEAGFAPVVGLFLLLFPKIIGEKPKSSLLISGVLLIVLGSLIRLEALVPPLVVFLPIWITQFRSLWNRTYFATFSIAALLVLAGIVLNNTMYASNPAWSDFVDYSSARTQIQDTARINNIIQSNDTAKLAPIHWSMNDVQAFRTWFFPDSKVYSLENFQYLIKEFPQNQPSALTTWNSFIAFLESTYIFPYSLLFLSSFLLLITVQPKKTHLVSFFLSSNLVMGIFLYLEWNLKLVDRVAMPAMIAITMLNLLFWCNDHPSVHHIEVRQEKKAIPGIMKFFTGIIILSSIAIIFTQDISLSRLNSTRENLYSNIVSDIETLIEKGNIPQNALLLDSGLPVEWSNPFSMNLPPFHFIVMGWLTNSPTYNETLSRNGIQSMVSALYQKNNIFMFADSEHTFLEQYIWEHDGVRVSEKIVYSYSDPTGVYGTQYLCQLIEK